MNQKTKKPPIENVSEQASEELYQALFEQAADGIFIADNQGRCIDVNRHGCKMLGYTREELLGFTMEDLVTAEDSAHDPLQLDEIRVGTTLLNERHLRCKDGRFLPVEISVRMLTDGRFLSIVRDISEREQAEEQLRESNERFRLLAESSLTGIYLIQDNRFRYVNPAMAQIFGYKVEEITDKLGPMDMVYPDDRLLVTENLRRRIAGEIEVIHYDFLGLRKDGSAIDIEVYGRRIEYSGKTGVIGTLLDVTKRKQTEEALRRNRETALQFSDQLATLQEVTNQLSKAESSNDLIRQAVQLGRSRLGFDRVSIWFIDEHQSIMRGSFGTDEHGQLRDERNAIIKFRPAGLAWRVFSQKESNALVEHHLLYNHKGQEVGEGDNAIAALWDGDEVIGIISVDNLLSLRPITERQLEVLRLYATTLGHLITRKQAEEALRASEARFRTFVDHAADAFYLHDNKGTILDVNQKACKSLGYSRDELIGKTPKEFDAAPDRPPLNQLEKQLDAGEEIAFETTHRRKDGTEFPVEVRGRPFWQGEQRFSVSLARDISERKRTQEALTLFRTLIDHTYDVVEVIDPETGRFLDANEQAWLTLGYSREEFLTLSVPEINPLVAERSWQETLVELRQSGSIVRESQHQRKDGSIFPIEININYIHLDRDYILAVVRDITTRKQVEEALRESEERLRQIASSLREVVWLRDVQTRQVLYVNPAFQELTGWSCESFYEDRDLMMNAIHPDDKEWVSKALDQRFESVPFGKEHRIIHLDGSVRWVWSQIFPVRNEVGEVYRWASIMEDITERKQAEDALRASEEQYRALYRDNPSIFFTLDGDGKIISVNAFGASHLGYTIDELEGQPILNVIFEDDRTAVTTQLQQCIQNPGQINQWQLRKVHKDGRLLWVEEFARAIIDPHGAIHVLTVCQDITDRKQAEIEQKHLLARIREQAQQVQNIVDTVPEGVILLSKDQSVTLTNPVAREFLTLLAPEFQNGSLTHLGQRPLNELLTSPPKGLWHELTNDDLIFEAITRPVENGPENGGWVLVLRDITQERDIQQRVHQQERLAAVGQLAAGIAHDFNNILAVINLYSQLILRTVEMSSRDQERMHTIEQQITRATDLIQQILDFSRQSVLERQPFDLLSLLEELVTLLKRTLPEHIHVELHHSAEAYFIQGDPTRTQQVMMNLAVNARDAMPKGGHLQIRLATIQTEEAKSMFVQDLPPGDWVQIEVADSGSGIPPEMLSHIFEPFFTTKEAGKGTGLGLAQVYGIIQQHEGYIDVVTEVGQGTSFFLYFPMLNIADKAPTLPQRTELQMGQGQRVLVVEDDPNTRMALIDSLALLNYEVLEATNGREALKILATEADEVKLVLSDVVMPEMGGIALFHAMQQQKLTIPVVLLTGHPLSNEMEELEMLSLAGWMPKPPDLVSLSTLLAQVLTS